MLGCVWLVWHPLAISQETPVASPPLHQRIDLILSPLDNDPLTSDPETDGHLLRRLSLDLRNVVPTQEELDQFIVDAGPDRWTRWIEQFQRDPLSKERLVDWYDKSLMQRRPHQHVDRNLWLALLRSEVDAETPLDALMREMVSSVWWNPSQRALQRFFLDRGGDPHFIARDLGRVLFGRDMQCAQCHDHPQIDDYLQVDYHGLLAFVSPSALLEATTKNDQGAEQKIQLYVERASGDAPFESVFDKGVKFRTAARVPGRSEQFEAYAAPDLRYQPQPNPDALPGVGAPPMASRRALLASQLQGSNRAFAENWANRLWALMLGRGLVHPLDMHHSDNPASHPELLAALTDALIESNFHVPQVLAEIAKSKVYQRGNKMHIDSMADTSSVLSLPPGPPSVWGAGLSMKWSTAQQSHKELTERQASLQSAMEQARDQWRAIQQERTPLRAELDAAEATFQEALKKVAEAQSAFDQATAAEQSATSKVTLLDDAASKLEQAKSAPDDPELQPAIEAAKTRAEQLRATLAGLQQATLAATAQRDATISARETERAKWQAIVDRISPVEQRLGEADTAFVQSRAAHDHCRTQANEQLRRIGEVERAQRWVALSQQAMASRAQMETFGRQLQEYQTSVEPVRTQLAEAELLLSQSHGAIQQHEAAMTVAGNHVGTLEAEINSLVATKSALASSSALVTDPQALAAATMEIDRAIAMRTDKLTEAKSAVAGMAQGRVDLETHRDLAMAAREAASAAWQATQMERARRETEIASAQAELQSLCDKCQEARVAVVADCQQRHALAVERPLSPEQLAWSILRSTQVLQNYILNEHAELEKQSALPADASSELRAARALQATRGAMDKLRGNVDVFSNLYASGVGQTSDEFFASPDQALYVANGGAIYSWAGPSGTNVSNQLVQQADPNAAARQLYWSLLSREPTAEEQQFVHEQLSSAGDQRSAIVQELVWSVLASVEYRLYP